MESAASVGLCDVCLYEGAGLRNAAATIKSISIKKAPRPISENWSGAGLTRKMGDTMRKTPVAMTNRCWRASSRPSGLMAMDARLAPLYPERPKRGLTPFVGGIQVDVYHERPFAVASRVVQHL